jgi:transcriptional regulator
MYSPTQFREQRPEVLGNAIREIQLATLITGTPDGYHASHVPMVLKEESSGLVLEAHVARQNDHWTILQDRALPSLAVFQGPHAYVSPGWYETKRQHGKVVPTWNYIAVHAHGPLEIVEGGARLLTHLNDLTTANESGREQPWAISDAPPDFIRNLARAIVGLRLRVDRIEGSWKMTQHRSEGDRHGAMAGLSASSRPGDRAVAEIMRQLEATRVASGGG